MGNNNSRSNMVVNSIQDLDDSIVLNQGTAAHRMPQLTFHQIRGTNVQLAKGGRVAKRTESFCKGLTFSSRPICIDEVVCLKQLEVATNWSGVLRFGVTTIDPETYRNDTVPKFACPDLTSKQGYWAKALPERYSVEGNILHFWVNSAGELYYGINHQNKGLFLMGINTTQPLWVILDIYGNSTAVEFIDRNEHRGRPLNTSRSSMPPSIPAIPSPSTNLPSTSTVSATSEASTSTAQSNIAFHRVVGRHITLSESRTVATRTDTEYNHGYVFTDRPVANNEKITIQILRVIDLYAGGLAVGVTCSDPSGINPMDLPADSANLVDMPDMYVGIKDVIPKPQQFMKASFWITEKGELMMQVGENEPRLLIFVDNSLALFFYFEVYGTAQSIRIEKTQMISRARSPAVVASSSRSMSTSSATGPSTSRLADTVQPTHVALPPKDAGSSSSSSASSAPRSPVSPRYHLDVDAHYRNLLPTSFDPTRWSRPPLPSRRATSMNSDDLLSGPNPSSLPPPLAPQGTHSATNVRALQPPPITPRPASANNLASAAGTVAPPPRPVPPPVSSIPGRRPAMPPPTTAPPARPALPSRTRPVPSTPSPAPVAASGSSGGGGGKEGDEMDECVICMNGSINTVIYTCGHMCMCYECAISMKDRGSNCPICRNPMQDIIKTYKN